jgi:hypothetical protein
LRILGEFWEFVLLLFLTWKGMDEIAKGTRSIAIFCFVLLEGTHKSGGLWIYARIGGPEPG